MQSQMQFAQRWRPPRRLLQLCHVENNSGRRALPALLTVAAAPISHCYCRDHRATNRPIKRFELILGFSPAGCCSCRGQRQMPWGDPAGKAAPVMCHVPTAACPCWCTPTSSPDRWGFSKRGLSWEGLRLPGRP